MQFLHYEQLLNTSAFGVRILATDFD